MTLAITFVTGWLLLGLAAAAIPLVLHLLASVRAPQELFPTLRFLKMGMEKTARRRRLEHWLLLLIRSALLALLAMALAEPILKSTSGFLSDKRFAAVIIVDNSYSMGVSRGGESRLDVARREASQLLGGSDRPSAAALILTNSSDRPENLRSDLDVHRQKLSQAGLSSGRANMTECVREAMALLKNSTAPQKAIYIFSDMQRISFENLPEHDTGGVPLMLVDCSGGVKAVNVGIGKLKITGSRIVGRDMKFTATLVNSSPTDKEVHAWLQVDGIEVSDEPIRKILPAAKDNAPSETNVQFVHAFGEAGVHVGQVAIREADDLTVDNVRRFSLRIGDEIRALLVAGTGQVAGYNLTTSSHTLTAALDSVDIWSIRRRTVGIDRFGANSLVGVQAVFFADVPEFTPDQAAAIIEFVRGGGSAVFFLGPAVKTSNYNKRFSGMLPGRITQAIGQVGMEAGGLRAVKNLRHPYLAGLYETPADYREIIIQRYYRMERLIGDHETVLSSPAGDAILSTRDFGSGRVVLATTTAGREWNNLATTNLLLPMVTRMCFEAAEHLGADNTFSAGAAVRIHVEGVTGKSSVNVTMPDGPIEVLTISDGSEAVFTKTNQPGIYRWLVAADGPAGAFAINPAGVESDLSAIAPDALAKADVYFGETLDDVHKSAAEAAAGDNLWDRLLAIVILLLVIEAVVANRFRRGDKPTPAHLNPSLAA